MRQEIKAYYEVHFGSFNHQSVKDIEKACYEESPLADLNGFLYLKKGWARVNKQSRVPHYLIRAKLLESIAKSQN